ncbi:MULTISPECIES: cytochrome P450 [Mycolicibacterium]|jgi:cytochrome P450|uniref:Cytochrome P450 n=1 Tax=Mycolicibacterium austroafricanum TaxID=39687 RepID=A0ABT8H6T4_MYCAO|nr:MULTISPECIES: cytochrome P450 [Mycolicibacterium]MDN4516474.1 cytochrome P450 [Mycolicibacterium austroafricanum]MDW5610095.1 cytochrome P450 [Mycolicibacterium sp. D5.8-2]PQP44468.1 cytochrome P450 [Mycolicibacterium austroafricanum]QRZ07126.1 cytochrome P450 [Mycolicibacterium austroafricanum]QZT57152.1 cytochrome P450 [Mycolicibacterium austroafricanum]
MTRAPRLTGVRALRALADLGLPSIAAGPIARRRHVVGLLDRWEADARGVRRLQLLRRRFGRGPVVLAIPGRRIVVPLDPADVAGLLEQSPYPFDPASWEKRHALAQFQPHAVLISRGDIRARRRRVNEAALDTGSELHRLADTFQDIVNQEAAQFADRALETRGFDSAQFIVAWWRLVRRLVLGAEARDDEAVTDDLWRLRTSANWSFLSLPHVRRRERLFARLYRYAEDPDPDSLMAALSTQPASGAVDPVGQVPHWLFAFDAAGMAALRAAALLCTHPDALARSETEDAGRVRVRPFLRASVLESVRLWPTTPAILREIAAPTTWHEGTPDEVTVAPPGTVLIPVPALHRDPDLVPFADEFTPDVWLDGRASQYPQLVPFSAGPAACPGRDLVLFVTSALLAALLSRLHLTLDPDGALRPGRPLPATLNQFGLSFGASVAPQGAAPS